MSSLEQLRKKIQQKKVVRQAQPQVPSFGEEQSLQVHVNHQYNLRPRKQSTNSVEKIPLDQKDKPPKENKEKGDQIDSLLERINKKKRTEVQQNQESKEQQKSHEPLKQLQPSAQQAEQQQLPSHQKQETQNMMEQEQQHSDDQNSMGESASHQDVANQGNEVQKMDVEEDHESTTKQKQAGMIEYNNMDIQEGEPNEISSGQMDQQNANEEPDEEEQVKQQMEEQNVFLLEKMKQLESNGWRIPKSSRNRNLQSTSDRPSHLDYLIFQLRELVKDIPAKQSPKRPISQTMRALSQLVDYSL